MGQSPVSHTICCSLREKYDSHGSGFHFPTGPPQFFFSEIHVGLDAPRLLAFAPLWQRDNSSPRRLAIASHHEVHVYLVDETDGNDLAASLEGDTKLHLRLEYQMLLDTDVEVTSMTFSDESSSRTLVVAAGPSQTADTQKRRAHQVRMFSCDGQAAPVGDMGGPDENVPPPVHTWKWNSDYTVSLEDHGAPVVHIVTSQTTVVTADSQGSCGTWKKNQGCSKRHASVKLHKGGLADIAVDRFFLYTCGREDRTISIWSVPDLNLVLNKVVEIPEELLLGLKFDMSAVTSAPSLLNEEGPDIAAPNAVGDSEASQKAVAKRGTCQFASLTALRRPLSRWAGSQGSSRSAKAPKGTLFVAAALADQCEVAGAGAGVLMEWALGDQVVCQSAQVAHDSPIVNIAYGPYDNGPVITADMRGTFRVWDCVPKLTLAQHLEFPGSPGMQPQLSIAVEPQRGLYSSNGDRRLFVWRRSQSSDLLFTDTSRQV